MPFCLKKIGNLNNLKDVKTVKLIHKAVKNFLY